LKLTNWSAWRTESASGSGTFPSGSRCPSLIMRSLMRKRRMPAPSMCGFGGGEGGEEEDDNVEGGGEEDEAEDEDEDDDALELEDEELEEDDEKGADALFFAVVDEDLAP
jgi:hypothetical protein